MDKLSSVDWKGLYSKATSKVKQYALNLTPLEVKVEEATNADTWGPHGSVMNEIADAAHDWENYRQIMGVIARRLQEKDANWRMCYKALLLLEHLLKHGPAKIVADVQSSTSVLERLTYFEYKDENSRDHGANVRHRAKEILSLINSPERMQEEREKARANRAKYKGVSAQEMRMGGSFGHGSSGFGGGGSSSFGRASGGGGYGSLGGASSFGRDRTSSGGGFGSLDPGHSGGLGGGRSSLEEGGEALYAGKRLSATSSAGEAAGAAVDPVAATRARIERMRLSDRDKEESAAAEDHSKKKLHDVKVNPKIAASLGLKPVTAAAPPAARPAAAASAVSTTAPAAPAPVMDLLGGLDEEPAPARAAAPAAAAAPSGGGWDAFGSASAPAAAPAPPAPAPAAAFDLLGGLAAPTPAAPAAPVMQPAPAAAVFDPFATPTPAAVPASAGFGAAAPLAPAPQPVKAVAAAGVPSALPESMFSDLTGISRPQQPMGHAGGMAAARPSQPAAGGFGAPLGPSGVAPHAPLADDFATFGTSSGGGSLGAPVPSVAPLGAMAAGLGPAGSLGQGSASAATSSADFGSFSYAPAAGGAAGGTSGGARDPFDDLFK